MPITPDEFLKKYGFDKEDEERDHSLRNNAMEHAKHLRRPHAGTPTTGKNGSATSGSIRMKWRMMITEHHLLPQPCFRVG